MSAPDGARLARLAGELAKADSIQRENLEWVERLREELETAETRLAESTARAQQAQGALITYALAGGRSNVD